MKRINLVSDNVKQLNIKTIERLIENNGLTVSGREYDLECLKDSRYEKSHKLADHTSSDHLRASGTFLFDNQQDLDPYSFGREYNKDRAIEFEKEGY
jgi:hypothetical protein